MPLPRPLPLITAALVRFGIGALATAPPSGRPSPPPQGAVVSVAGTGTASAVPDVVSATIGAEASAPTVDAALSGANEAARQMVDALTGQGVAGGDVRSAGVQVYPQFGRTQEVTGYTARQDLETVLRDVDAAGATIAAAVAAGGDAARLSGISFGLADDAALRTRARQAAFADARATAQQHAGLAGGRLGAVVSVSEEPGVPSFARGWSAQAATASSAVPLAPGTSQVSVTVQVRWSLAR